ncbi:MAG: hypothetical protein JWP81_4587 [Ferruginibacter sp.]|nr:hypothetical protein [Ferruginibacter sp.]
MKKIVLFAVFFFLISLTKAQTIASWKMKDVVNYFSRKTDSVYVINFWASFCKPCVAEIPYLQSISKKYARQKVNLLLVSLDLASFYPAKIESFTRKNNIGARVVWLNETDADYFCPLIDQKWSGSIPATVIINASSGYKKLIETEMSEKQFEAELKKAMEE